MVWGGSRHSVRLPCHKRHLNKPYRKNTHNGDNTNENIQIHCEVCALFHCLCEFPTWIPTARHLTYDPFQILFSPPSKAFPGCAAMLFTTLYVKLKSALITYDEIELVGERTNKRHLNKPYRKNTHNKDNINEHIQIHCEVCALFRCLCEFPKWVPIARHSIYDPFRILFSPHWTIWTHITFKSIPRVRGHFCSPHCRWSWRPHW